LSLNYYEPADVSTTFHVNQAGSYRVTLELAVKGSFEFDPGKCRVSCKLDGRELLNQEFGWFENKTFSFDFDEKWEAGEKRISFELVPLTPAEKKLHPIELRILQVDRAWAAGTRALDCPKKLRSVFHEGSSREFG
jgi:hypothetical protein